MQQWFAILLIKTFNGRGIKNHVATNKKLHNEFRTLTISKLLVKMLQLTAIFTLANNFVGQVKVLARLDLSEQENNPFRKKFSRLIFHKYLMLHDLRKMLPTGKLICP